MLKDHRQDAIDACINLLKKFNSTIGYSTGAIDCEFHRQLQRAHKVLRSFSFEFTPFSGKEASKFDLSSFESTNRIKFTDTRSDANKDRDDLYSEDSNHATFFQNDAVWCVVLSSFYYKKKKLSEKAFVALNYLLLCREVDFHVSTKVFLRPSSPPSVEGKGAQACVLCSVGEGVLRVLTEYLNAGAEAEVQAIVLRRLLGLLEGEGQELLTVHTIPRTLRALFTLAAWTVQTALWESCQRVLRQCVRCVVRRFVEEGFSLSPSSSLSFPLSLSSSSSSSPSLALALPVFACLGFAAVTPLSDYTTPVPPDAPYRRIDTCDVAALAWAARQATPPLPAHEVIEGDRVGQERTAGEGPLCLDPRRAGASWSRVAPLSTFFSFLPFLPAQLKALLRLVRVVCGVAMDPCGGASREGSAGVRLREMGLGMLQLVLAELPVANSAAEHPCAGWVALVLSTCGPEVIGCVVRNLSATAPFLFFDSAIHVLKLLLIKCHHHLARELHTTLVTFLLPLAKSKHCDFRRKYAVLSMVRDLFSSPRLLISLFINYDCNPTIGIDSCGGDLVETLVDFVVELAYLDYAFVDQEGSQLTQDEKQLLRDECFTVMHTLTSSLHRWIADDPEDPTPDLKGERNVCHNRIERMPNKAPVEACPPVWNGGDTLGKCWELSTTTDTLSASKANYNTNNHPSIPTHPMLATNVNAEYIAEIFHPEGTSQGKELITNAGMLFEGDTVQYHWKHIHYLLNNKRIFQKAAHLVNTGKWKEAKGFLESRKCLPVRMPSEAEKNGETVVGGSSNYAEFARFLYEYPGISRDAINKIVERVNKQDDRANLLLFRDYLSLFNYRKVPIDIALRDTICKFVSWEMPMFEVQIWETIQAAFGEVYAKQNPHVITAKDADAMAGALLFLHTNLHNANAKNVSLSVDHFVSACKDFLDFPPDVEDIRRIYERIKRKKWDLDMYDRTPQEVEHQLKQDQDVSSFTEQLLRQNQDGRSTQPLRSYASASVTGPSELARDASCALNAGQNEGTQPLRLSAHDGAVRWRAQPKEGQNVDLNTSDFITGENESNAAVKLQAVNLKSAQTPLLKSDNGIAFPRSTTATTNLGPGRDCDSTTTSTDLNAFSPTSSEDPSSFSLEDISLLNSKAPIYTRDMKKLKARGNQKMEFIETSMLLLKKLEASHMRLFGSYTDYNPQPYIFPYYAEHAQPLLLLTYPRVMACICLGFSIAEVAPLRWQLLETLQTLYDVAAAFMINVDDQQVAVAETMQRYLGAEDAHRLKLHTRATFAPLLLNRI